MNVTSKLLITLLLIIHSFSILMLVLRYKNGYFCKNDINNGTKQSNDTSCK